MRDVEEATGSLSDSRKIVGSDVVGVSTELELNLHGDYRMN